ncbi:hypothetical protein U9R90_11765 [Streptomyces sp. E11-3]|uniref:hypothetical protein n=1 Tax=Streptomyces sp. E11-3 TaxID=3110112 RepID=UPI00397EF54F
MTTDTTDVDEDATLLASAAHDPAGFEPLVLRHSAALHGYFARRAPGRTGEPGRAGALFQIWPTGRASSSSAPSRTARAARALRWNSPRRPRSSPASAPRPGS